MILLALSHFTYAQTPTEDLPDFTTSFILRSAYDGETIFFNRKHFSWNLKEIEVTQEFKDIDPLSGLFKLGLTQFVSTADSSLCIAIQESGSLGLKSCEEDLQDKKFETVFSIIPTLTSAVQIRSLVLNKDECISVFDNPRLPGGTGFGISKCDFDRLFPIDLRNLILILPAVNNADIIDFQ